MQKKDPCKYVKNITRNNKKSIMIIAIRVDDLILACNDAQKDCKLLATPIDPNQSLIKLKDDEQSVCKNLQDYQAVIGCLTYALTISRLDLATSIGIIRKFMSKHWNHLKAVKRVLRYIKGSLNVGLKFASCQTYVDVIGFTDADWAGDVVERKSTSGYVFQICGGTVSWRSKRQEIVALSSTEAEYIALSFAAQEPMWLRSFLKDLGYEQQTNILNEDNQGAIALSKNPDNHSGTKHIDVRYHYIRDLVEKKRVEVNYCPTNNNLADLMTKGLPRPRFEELCKKLGIIKV